jgi:chitinase
MLLLAIIAGATYGVCKLILAGGGATGARRAVPAFAPYVDVTLTPTYPFQSPAANPVSSAYLGFVVSRSGAPCTPTWGGYYTLGGAGTSLDLDARIAQLRAQGGRPMISFGGQANTELAVSCLSQTRLADAYLAPISRYRATTIDLDIEGAALDDRAADVRRAGALAIVAQRLAAHGSHLRVWVTLPVTAQGLTPQGIAAARALVSAHVPLAGVNAMAMDFGPGQGASRDMFATIQRSLYATHAQVRSLYPGLSSAAAWQHVGVTTMIGVNDVAGERFTIADARRLATFAAREGLPRVSAWSLNRDSECGGAFARLGVVSNTCSGVAQSPLQFTAILSRLRGTTTARTAAASATVAQVQAAAPDDPAISPYPIWQAGAAYNTGYKVVWHRAIYQARWWSQGTAPDASSGAATPGPWLLLGPVPAGSRAPRPQLLNRARHQPWSATAVYRQGAEVSYGGLPYRARWYTRGDQPSSALPAAPQTPWEPLFTAPGEPSQLGSEVN